MVTTHSQRFTGQVALVTGAGEGIGYEIARRLVAEGAQVLLNDVDSTKAEQAAASIRAEGGQCVGIGGDVADPSAIEAMVSAAQTQFGRLDIAIANAGITLYGDFFSYTPERLDRVLGVNLRGSFFTAQAAAQRMRAQGSGGRILLMSSVTGHQAIRYLGVYGMTKAALEMLARALVIELAPHGITINCVAPGATITPRNLADDPDYAAHWGSVTPTQRPASTSDIAEAALFLCSPAAAQITGQTLVVDGGWTAISPTPALDFAEGKQ